MHIAYLAVTILTAFMNGYAATMNFVGAESVKVVADKVQVSQRWMVPFGVLLAAGAVGLMIGFAVPALGIAAASVSSPTSSALSVPTSERATATSAAP